MSGESIFASTSTEYSYSTSTSTSTLLGVRRNSRKSADSENHTCFFPQEPNAALKLSSITRFRQHDVNIRSDLHEISSPRINKSRSNLSGLRSTSIIQSNSFVLSDAHPTMIVFTSISKYQKLTKG